MTFRQWWAQTPDQQEVLVAEYFRPFGAPAQGLGSFSPEEMADIEARTGADDLMRRVEEVRHGSTN